MLAVVIWYPHGSDVAHFVWCEATTLARQLENNTRYLTCWKHPTLYSILMLGRVQQSVYHLGDPTSILLKGPARQSEPKNIWTRVRSVAGNSRAETAILKVLAFIPKLSQIRLWLLLVKVGGRSVIAHASCCDLAITRWWCCWFRLMWSNHTCYTTWE